MSARFLRRRAGVAAALSLLLLGGCASLQAPPASEAAQATPAATRPYLAQANLSGRLSVRYQAQGKEEALHGSFSWAQTPEFTGVTLYSPLGQTIAIIEVSRAGATLSQAGQPLRSAGDVDALVADTLGWPLPIAGLRDWLQGFAIDAAGNAFVATPQANEVRTRDGWLIRYPAWQEAGTSSTAAMPRRIDLERTTPQAGLVSIRMVIDPWQS